jgi:uncharacterized membrane protein
MKIFDKLSLIVFWLFCLEYLVLSCELDLFPSCLMGIMCVAALYIKSKSDVDIVYQEEKNSQVRQIIKFLMLSLFVIMIFLIFITFDISVISSYILVVFTNSKIIRFIVYGLIYPIITSYLMFYCWANEKAIDSEGLTTNPHFYYILIVNLYIGFFICYNWSYYLNLSQLFLSMIG